MEVTTLKEGMQTLERKLKAQQINADENEKSTIKLLNQKIQELEEKVLSQKNSLEEQKIETAKGISNSCSMHHAYLEAIKKAAKTETAEAVAIAVQKVHSELQTRITAGQQLLREYTVEIVKLRARVALAEHKADVLRNKAVAKKNRPRKEEPLN